jgi:hypothetical protein
MNVRQFALVLGIIFVIVGVLGFVPGITQMDHADHPDLTVESPGHGMLLGLFHVNVLHNAVHLLFGVLGIAMSRRFDHARLYAQIVAIAYGLLVVLGLIPATRYLFGLVPIEGHDVWLHALIALVAAYFGFIAPMVNEADMTTDRTNSAATPRT